tara:strand:+ start:99 stop:413 length:315 start_codon:yes stop_codon:yes gene_type:complete
MTARHKLFDRHPDKIPVIIIKHRTTYKKDPTQFKFLIQKDILLCKLICILRERIKMKAEDALFLYSHKTETLLSMDDTLGDIYDFHKDEDDILYLIYSGEDVFG